MAWTFWIILCGIFLIVEMITVGFLVFWLGIAAAITAFISLFISNIFVQSIIFVALSTLLILLTKPFVNKFIDKDKKVNTNAYSILDKTGIVTQDINSKLGVGQIKVDNQAWSAKTSDENIISKGTEVKIKDIEGVKAVVEVLTK